MEKARDIQKSIYFCFIDYAKAFDCVDHNKLRKILIVLITKSKHGFQGPSLCGPWLYYWPHILLFLFTCIWSGLFTNKQTCTFSSVCVCVCVSRSIQFSSVQSLSRVWLFATPWVAACQASLSITNSRSSLKLMSIESVMPSSHLILCCPLLLLPSISFPMSQLFTWSGQSIRVSTSASVLPMNTQDWSPLDQLDLKDLVGSPCSPRDSQESSPTPQFKSINSLALSFLYGSTLTSVHDHWKNHSLD